MGRTAIADDTLLPYIQNLSYANADVCTIGLILGQTTNAKDFIMHFAKTPSVQTADKFKKNSETAILPNKIDDICEPWVSDHAKQATRMLPGGMYVLGIFVVSKEDVLNPFHSKLRSILSQIHKQLTSNFYLFGNDGTPEKLVLNYCTITKNYFCKSYNVITSAVKPVDFKFLPKAMKWNQLECKFDIDQTFPIFKGTYDWPLKRHLQAILESVHNSFQSAVFMFDNEIKDKEETIDSLGKKKKINKSKNTSKDKNESKSIQVSIFIPYDNKDYKTDLEITGCGGHIRIMGTISSKLWLFPKMTITEASNAVLEDIIRSLASRLEMHWDSLVDEESGSSEDTNSLHEPPRRVLITLPNNKVMLSDYLFPGEGAHEAFMSLQELLDINLKDKKNIIEVEGQADLTELYPSPDVLPADSEETLPISLPDDSSKYMYIVGTVIALIVLIISLAIHFFKN